VKILTGKTAIVTGAANGIGAATAIAFAKEGMNVVIADIQEENLKIVANQIKNLGVECISIRTDVSDSSQIEKLAEASVSKFHSVDVLFNNAGVLHVASILEHSENDWQWVLGVNLFGVINCVRVFAPVMKSQNTEAHIVNTASIGGFTTGPGLAAYKTSKHAVIAFSEVLEAELKGTSIGISVLCPGWTNTGIMQSDSARPERYNDLITENRNMHEVTRNIQRGIKSAKKGADSEVIAKCVLRGIMNDEFFIIPDRSFHEKLQERVSRILGKSFEF
jgi:NAD(P)-dependent dehydrogenase (short-subunit alcohol dehydrogenase family)